MLKLNLILNGLVASLDNVIQGDTLASPYHKSEDGKHLKQFDYIVSNPPFKMDFSETRDQLAEQKNRFWAGVPSIPPKKPEKMAIYTCFIQHVINSLKPNGKGAIVVPTGFLTAKAGIENKIIRHIVDEKIIYGAISMPSNVFATTGTNVSVLFFDNSRKNDKVILIDASKMGEEYQEGNNKKRRLRDNEIGKIVNTFLNKKNIDDFSIAVTYDEIKEKNYSLSAGQYFEIKIEYIPMTKDEFENKINRYKNELSKLFDENLELEKQIKDNLENIKYE